MPGWEQLGMQAASQGLSGAMGLMLGKIYDRRQLKQQEKLQNLQIKGDKQLTDYNFMKQMEMWKNTNYPAQMAMLKAAGLNPALMYEGGGQGGSTNISTGSVTGANAPVGGQEIQQMMAMGLTRDLQLAQIENIKAQTNKTKAETTAVAPGIAKTEAETKSITADIANKEVQNELLNIEQEVMSKTQNVKIADALQQLREGFNRMEIMERENKLSAAQFNEKKQLLTAQVLAEQTRSKLMGTEMAKNAAQIEEIVNAIKQKWSLIDIQADQLNINRLLANFETGFGKQYGQFAQVILQTLKGFAK